MNPFYVFFTTSKDTSSLFLHITLEHSQLPILTILSLYFKIYIVSSIINLPFILSQFCTRSLQLFSSRANHCADHHLVQKSSFVDFLTSYSRL